MDKLTKKIKVLHSVDMCIYIGTIIKSSSDSYTMSNVYRLVLMNEEEFMSELPSQKQNKSKSIQVSPVLNNYAFETLGLHKYNGLIRFNKSGIIMEYTPVSNIMSKYVEIIKETVSNKLDNDDLLDELRGLINGKK